MALVEGQCGFIGGLGVMMVHYPKNFPDSKYRDTLNHEDSALLVPLCPTAQTFEIVEPDSFSDFPKPLDLESLHAGMSKAAKTPMIGDVDVDRITSLLASKDITDVVRIGHFCSESPNPSQLHKKASGTAAAIINTIQFYNDVYLENPEKTRDMLILKKNENKHKKSFKKSSEQIGRKFSEAVNKGAKLQGATAAKSTGLQEGDYGFCPVLGGVFLRSGPVPHTNDGITTTGVAIEALNPMERDTKSLFYDAIKELPSKDELKAAVALMSQPQEPISEADFEAKYKELFESGELDDLGRIVSYTNGREGDMKGYRDHAFLALASVQMARRLKERGLAPPRFESDQWNRFLGDAVSHVGKQLPDCVIITPTIEENDAAKQQADFEEEKPKLMEMFVEAFGDHAEQYRDIAAARNKKGKKANKEQDARKAAGLSARPSFDEITPTEGLDHTLTLIFDEVDELVEEAKWESQKLVEEAKWKSQQAVFEREEPIEHGKEWQVAVLKGWIAIADPRKKPHEIEIVNLFENDQLTFREASLVISGAFRGSATEDLIQDVMLAELNAYLYEDSADIVTKDKDDTKCTRVDAVAKAIDALRGADSDAAIRAKQHLSWWIVGKKGSDMTYEVAPT